MKRELILWLILLIMAGKPDAQRTCATYTYQQKELAKDPSLRGKMNSIEVFTQQQINNSRNSSSRTTQTNIISIPVVVHILYHFPYENISDAQVINQINELNRDFRRKNPDSIKTPAVFRPSAADCEIEFYLATSDPGRRSTNGIVRKYTPIQQWEDDDKMKFTSEMGDDAWDVHSYLNIWVCNLPRLAGYSSLPGGPDSKDGIVIDLPVFGTNNSKAGYEMGKTTVHEIGHWLNLKHLWGDADCGDDFVDDTPRQSIYTSGCPSGIRISCNNGPNGDMYMDYMDFTDDGCMNMFTAGQKTRMRTLFSPGGLRESILSSTGLSTALYQQAPVPDDSPQWLFARLYPNPVSRELTLDLSYDIRWLGKTISVINIQGQSVLNFTVTSKIQKIDVSSLQKGMYILTSKKDDGDLIRQKFIRL